MVSLAGEGRGLEVRLGVARAVLLRAQLLGSRAAATASDPGLRRKRRSSGGGRGGDAVMSESEDEDSLNA